MYLIDFQYDYFFSKKDTFNASMSDWNAVQHTISNHKYEFLKSYS